MKHMRKTLNNKTFLQTVKGFVVGLLILGCFSVKAADLLPVSAYSNSNTSPNLHTGAQVFVNRCSLCHGRDGMGGGMLATSHKDYPSTNLVKPRHSKSLMEVRAAVIWGGTKGRMDMRSPPWGNELSWNEIESVSQFVIYLRKDTENALNLLNKKAMLVPPSKKNGHRIYRSRCMNCHGTYGEGDGNMAKIIRNPPPFNLTKSTQTDEYLKKIISEGGEAVSRSPQMPPWGDELNDSEIQSLVMYLKTLRE